MSDPLLDANDVLAADGKTGLALAILNDRIDRRTLAGVDLSGANLAGANLMRADLRGADLSGANLRRTNLYKADLRGADLRRTDLRSANLADANLTDARLGDPDDPDQGAKIGRETVTVRGRKSFGEMTSFFHASLDGADLSGVLVPDGSLRTLFGAYFNSRTRLPAGWSEDQATGAGMMKTNPYSG